MTGAPDSGEHLRLEARRRLDLTLSLARARELARELDLLAASLEAAVGRLDFDDDPCALERVLVRRET